MLTCRNVVTGAVLMLSLLMPAMAQDAAPRDGANPSQQNERPGRQRRGGRAETGDRPMRWQLGIQTYTFNRFTFVEAVNKARDLGVRAVEGFAWQKIGGDAGDTQLNHKAPAEAIAVAQKALEDAGVRLVSYYVANFGDEEEARKYFQFARKMGIRQFVCEPTAEQLDLLDKLAQEYRVRIAIHNHPKDPKKDDYKHWDPDAVLELIRGRSRMIGCCADTGHWIRSGLDPVECLKKYEGRLFSLHMKDVKAKERDAHDVPFGTGVGNVEGQLKELARQKFSGLIAIEYEHNMEDNQADVKQCVEFFRKASADLGVRAGGGGGRGRQRGN